MAKYRNYCAFLDEFFEVLTSADEFKESKEIRFRCKTAGHENVLTAASFKNKKDKYPQLETWCEMCQNIIAEAKAVEETQKEFTHLGHEILEVKGRSFIKFRCGNCGDIRTNTRKNLQRPETTTKCGNCQSADRRLAYEDIVRDVEAVTVARIHMNGN